MPKLVTNFLKLVKERNNLIKEDKSIKQGEVLWKISNTLEKVMFSLYTFIFLPLQSL
jgi:hypothetical protein